MSILGYWKLCRGTDSPAPGTAFCGALGLSQSRTGAARVALPVGARAVRAVEVEAAPSGRVGHGHRGAAAAAARLDGAVRVALGLAEANLARRSGEHAMQGFRAGNRERAPAPARPRRTFHLAPRLIAPLHGAHRLEAHRARREPRPRPPTSALRTAPGRQVGAVAGPVRFASSGPPWSAPWCRLGIPAPVVSVSAGSRCPLALGMRVRELSTAAARAGYRDCRRRRSLGVGLVREVGVSPAGPDYEVLDRGPHAVILLLCRRRPVCRGLDPSVEDAV